MRRFKNRVGLALLLLFCLAMLAGCGAQSATKAETAETPEPIAQTEPLEQAEPAAAAATPEPIPLPEEPAPAGEPLRLIVATDLHYISPRISDFGAAFMKAMSNGDGKLSECAEAIVDELVRVTLAERPSALVLCGDLTYNGEQASLGDLLEKLRTVQNAGIPVLLLPGNHDIGSHFAFSFEGDTAYYATNISQPDFLAACREFGYDRALARDEGSFSYVYALAEDCRLLFLDANTVDKRGGIREETLAWAEEQLAEAQVAGATVITVTHQNLLRQNSMLYNGYVLSNAKSTEKLLRQYGVQTTLSGHSHHQHKVTEEGLTDYCTGSLSVAPLMYASVEIDELRAVSYRQEHLTILQEAARERMWQSGMSKIAGRVAELELDEETQTRMTDFAVGLNLDFFAGMVDAEAARADPAWALWEKYGTDISWLPYMRSMLES